MDQGGQERRDKAKEKVAAARYASGSIVGSGPPPAPQRQPPNVWSANCPWPISGLRWVFFAEAVRRIGERVGGDARTDAGIRDAAVGHLVAACFDGRVRTFARDDYDGAVALSRAFWGRADACKRADHCRAGDHWIDVSGPDLQQLLETLPPPTAESAAEDVERPQDVTAPQLSATPPGSRAAAEPTWRMGPDERQSSWFLRPEVLEEAERRRTGRSLAATARALVEMGRACGRELKRESLLAQMRQSGQFARYSRTETGTSRT